MDTFRLDCIQRLGLLVVRCRPTILLLAHGRFSAAKHPLGFPGAGVRDVAVAGNLDGRGTIVVRFGEHEVEVFETVALGLREEVADGSAGSCARSVDSLDHGEDDETV